MDIKIVVEQYGVEGAPGLRSVEVPETRLAWLEAHLEGEAGAPRLTDTQTRELLDLVFECGQRDLECPGERSVSVGDVIRLDRRRYFVCTRGFAEVPEGYRPGVLEILAGEPHLDPAWRWVRARPEYQGAFAR